MSVYRTIGPLVIQKNEKSCNSFKFEIIQISMIYDSYVIAIVLPFLLTNK